MNKNEENFESLSNPKILKLFISSLNNLHKPQENKRKNNKKFMNLFSVKVTKYDDSSSHYRTDDKTRFRGNKYDISHRTFKKKSKNIKKKLNKLIDSSKEKFHPDNNSNNENNEYECNSDSSIFTQEKKLQLNKEKIKRNTISLTKNQFPKSERSKLIKNKFNKQMDQAKLKKFLKEDMNNQNLGINYNHYRTNQIH